VRFAGTTIYEGENDPQGLNLKVWLHPKLFEKTADSAKADQEKKDKDEKKDKPNEKKKADNAAKLKITVTNLEGDTVRNISRRVDSTMCTVRWGLESNGVRFASKEKPEPDADAPGGGPTVPPGKYKLQVEFKGLKDSTFITVTRDPRILTPEAELGERYRAIRDFHKEVKRSSDTYNRLKDMEETIARVESAYTHVPDSLKKDLNTDAKALRDSINTIKELFFPHTEPKGIQRNPSTIHALCYNALGFLGGQPGAPTPNSLIAVQEAQRAIESVVARVDNLQKNAWSAWRTKAQAIQFSLFGP
jgi:hypothetical protein